jgi:predicted PurR-regulated permease PerM
MENNQHYKLNSYIFLAFIVAFALFLLYSISSLFTSFLGALMFYVLSKPMVEWLIKKKKWNKNAAAVLVIIISFFIVLLPIILIGGLLYQEVNTIANNPEIIIKPIYEFDSLVKEKFNIQLLSAKNLGNIQSFATGIFSSALNVGINFFTSITMMYFFLFFLLTNINRLEAAIILYLPFKKTNIKLFGKELVAQTISNALGVPLIAVIHGILAYIAYKIAGLEQAAFWSIITAVSSVIPIVGTALIWLPVSLFLFIKGETNYGIFIVAWGVIVIGLSDNLIRFLLAKKMADVHPIVTVLGIIIGLKYFGFTGLIFGPLMISYFIILLKIYYNQYQKPMKNKRKQKPSSPSYFHFPLLKGKDK